MKSYLHFPRTIQTPLPIHSNNTLLNPPRGDPSLIRNIDLLNRHTHRLGHKEERPNNKQQTRPSENETSAGTEVAGIDVVDVGYDEGGEPGGEGLHYDGDGHGLAAESVAGEFGGDGPAETLEEGGLQGDEDVPECLLVCCLSL